VGDSLVDEAHRMTARSYGKHRLVVMPVVVIVGKTSYASYGRLVAVEKEPHVICKKGEAILDIGPATIRLYAAHLKRAKTILWNGALGYFEQKPFDTGTKSIARLVAARSKGAAFGVIGGGETVQVMEMIGKPDDIDLVSTGGGAMLEFLAGKKLPGIEALKKH
jgi:phosphoglycerate kinase